MTNENLRPLIDAYGDLKACIAELELKKKSLEESLSGLEPASYEGTRYRLTISNSVREAPDDVLKAEFKQVLEDYRATLSRQYLQAHMGETVSRSHRVSARTGKKVAA